MSNNLDSLLLLACEERASNYRIFEGKGARVGLVKKPFEYFQTIRRSQHGNWLRKNSSLFFFGKPKRFPSPKFLFFPFLFNLQEFSGEMESEGKRFLSLSSRAQRRPLEMTNGDNFFSLYPTLWEQKVLTTPTSFALFSWSSTVPVNLHIISETVVNLSMARKLTFFYDLRDIMAQTMTCMSTLECWMEGFWYLFHFILIDELDLIG